MVSKGAWKGRKGIITEPGLLVFCRVDFEKFKGDNRKKVSIWYRKELLEHDPENQ